MLKFEDVFKTYENGTKALKGINLTIEDGEFVFIVGPSGSGKSTIIKMLSAEVRPTSGKVSVNGYDIGTIKQREIPYLRRTVGVVFQDFRLIENKSVYENVAFVMRAVGTPSDSSKSGSPMCWTWWACSTRPGESPVSFRAASSSVLPSPGRW